MELQACLRNCLRVSYFLCVHSSSIKVHWYKKYSTIQKKSPSYIMDICILNHSNNQLKILIGLIYYFRDFQITIKKAPFCFILDVQTQTLKQSFTVSVSFLFCCKMKCSYVKINCISKSTKKGKNQCKVCKSCRKRQIMSRIEQLFEIHPRHVNKTFIRYI